MSPIAAIFAQMIEPKEQARIGVLPSDGDDERVFRVLMAYDKQRLELAQLHACVREFMAESVRMDWLEKKSREGVNDMIAPSLPMLAWDDGQTVRDAIDAEIEKENNP